MPAHHLRTHRPKRRGFTLVEILIALAILLVLTRMALPAWHTHVRRMHRAEARTVMLDALLTLERHHLAANTYGDTNTPGQVAGTWPLAVRHAQQPIYRIEASPCTALTLAQCAELRAIPVRDDPQCGTLILRTTGEALAQLPGQAESEATSTAGNTGCW
ncbi:MAG TPA: prepilin-type N-terminal cleavage/methylation domain-containing protein [Burkholderiaceae bacterium]|nr:prepilin-type N-terminal cleavage/methylation domain-containing protein [Burkholderiaceae bacterium]